MEFPCLKPRKILASQPGQGLEALDVLVSPQKARKCWQGPSVSGAGTQHGGFVNRAVPAFDAVVGPRGRTWSVGFSRRRRGWGRLATGLPFGNMRHPPGAIRRPFDHVCPEHGIEYGFIQPSHLYSSNGQVERRHRTIAEAKARRYCYRTASELKKHP